MILKEQDDSARDIATLTQLLTENRLSARTRQDIEAQIRNIKSGNRGEADAAYEIKVHYGTTPDWVVIHDLRLEHDGLVAQIDHLLINRLLDVWVCESKRFANGIKINDQGEFTTSNRSRFPQAVSSPIEQNRRHVKLLQQVVDSGSIVWPTRLGITLKPQIRSLVLISRAAIQRPEKRVPGLETVIKTEQLHTTITKRGDTASPFDLAKLIGSATLENIGRQFVNLHRPIEFNWRARFGIDKLDEPPAATRLGRAVTQPAPAPAPQLPKIGPKCCNCAADISTGIARYCRSNADKFQGKLYCMPCQKQAGTAPPTA